MSVSGIVVTVYCDGGFHEPEKLRFHGRATKSEILKALRSRGWVMKTDGRTFCPKDQRRGGGSR